MSILKGYWKSIIWAAIIAYGCLLREPRLPLPPMEGGDKWLHLIFFAILGALLYWESGKIGLQKGRLWLVAVILPIAYGGIIEVLQEHFFYPRTGDWIDWATDCIGIIFGAGIAYAVKKLIKTTTT
jgi:VanZ family protein